MQCLITKFAHQRPLPQPRRHHATCQWFAASMQRAGVRFARTNTSRRLGKLCRETPSAGKKFTCVTSLRHSSLHRAAYNHRISTAGVASA